MAATMQVLAFKRQYFTWWWILCVCRSHRWCCPNSTMAPRLLENVKVTNLEVVKTVFRHFLFFFSSQPSALTRAVPRTKCPWIAEDVPFELSFQQNSNIKPAISRSRPVASWMLDAIFYCVIPCTWRNHADSFAVAINIANVHFWLWTSSNSSVTSSLAWRIINLLFRQLFFACKVKESAWVG